MASSENRFIFQRIIRPIVVTICIVLLTCSAHADSVFFRTGGFWGGIVRSSTGDSVRLYMNGGHFYIASADIDSIRFDASDTITLHNGERIAGKVCCSMNDSLLIATGQGLRRIAEDTVSTVIRNSGGPLTVPSLPETDHQFAPTDVGVIGDRPPGMVFRLNGNLFVPFLKNEDAGLRYAYTYGQPANQYCYGAGLGIMLLEPLTFMVQYERYSTGTRAGGLSRSNETNEAYYDFVYASLELQSRFTAHSNWSYCFGIDLGFLRGTQEFHEMSGQTRNISESIEIERPRLEIEYSIPRSNFAVRSGVGYLLPVGNTIRFTGTTLNTSIIFRIPFVGGSF
jgi:hypothetical protein